MKKLTKSITGPLGVVYRSIMRKRLLEETKIKPKKGAEKLSDKIVNIKLFIEEEEYAIVYHREDMGRFNKFINNNNMGRIRRLRNEKYNEAIHKSMQAFEGVNFSDEENWKSLI